jgi:hypothetical protein
MPFAAFAPSPDPETNPIVQNDGWWPDINVVTAMATMRLDGTVTQPRLAHSLAAAMLEMNMDAPVAAWAAQQLAAGATKLEEVAAPQVGGESRLVYLYKRAVYSYAQADLIERYVDYDTTASGVKKSELQCEAPDDHRRNGRWAARQLVGEPRSTVELI